MPEGGPCTSGPGARGGGRSRGAAARNQPLELQEKVPRAEPGLSLCRRLRPARL